jgi:hypothetical protein
VEVEEIISAKMDARNSSNLKLQALVQLASKSFLASLHSMRCFVWKNMENLLVKYKMPLNNI